MAKLIPLTKGLETVVDDDIYDSYGHLKWCAKDNGRGLFYVMRTEGDKLNPIGVYLHRLITHAPKGLVVDHINGKTLDNRRENLRVVTNRTNVTKRKAKGFYWNIKAKRWHAQIGNGKEDGIQKVKFLGAYLKRHDAFMAVFKELLKRDPITAYDRLNHYMAEGVTHE